jgi:hypothetical protein
MSSGKMVSSFYRTAGISYLKYVNICTTFARQAVKVRTDLSVHCVCVCVCACIMCGGGGWGMRGVRSVCMAVAACWVMCDFCGMGQDSVKVSYGAREQIHYRRFDYKTNWQEPTKTLIEQPILN